MSYAFYFFSLSEEEFNDIVQNNDSKKFNKLANKRLNTQRRGASTQEFSSEFVELVENHHIARLLHDKAEKHDVLAPMADDGNARWFDHDAVQEIATAFAGVHWGCEIRKYCEENDEDFEYQFDQQVYIFDAISYVFKYAAARNFLIVTFSS